MANNHVNKPGQRQSATSPSGIANSQNYDLAPAAAVIDTAPATIEAISIATTEVVVKPNQLVRFTNTAAAVAFVWVGAAGASAAPTISNALAIPPNSAITIKFGQRADGLSSAFRMSAATVQAAILEQ
jgi:hypothetical protein